MTVLLVDDHEVVRRGLKQYMGDQPDLEVVGDVGSGEEALVQAERLDPDVAVVDLRLPSIDGIEVLRELRSRNPRTRCLILTSFADETAMFEAILAGAAGYLLKDARLSEIVEAVRQVGQGRALIDPKLTSELMRRVRGDSGPSVDELTDQEKRVLVAMADGLSNRQIGEQLHLAEQTVKNYVSSILSKLGMERRTQAAVWAARLGLRRDAS